MTKFLAGIIVLFLSGNTLNAQIVQGILTDETTKAPLSGATVKLLRSADSTTAYTVISDKSGVFQFNNVAANLYILSVSSIGYGDFTQQVSVKDSPVNLETVIVSKSAKVLNTITVNVTAPPVKQKTDTIEYSANQFKVNPDATVEDLIKKMPGVTVDKSGTVTAQGEQVRKVTIDGRDFFGDDATAALRNLPAEIIDKIQVFDKLSDQAAFSGIDDGNSQKALNVVTKANMRNGQFGRFYGGYGTDERYAAGGNVSFFKNNRRVSLVGNFNNINQQNFSSQDLLGVTSSNNNRGGGGQRGGQQGGNRGGGNFGGGGQGNFLVGQQNGISQTNAFGINYSNQWGKKLTVAGSYFFNNSKTNNDQLINRQTFLNGDSSLYYQEKSLSGINNFNNRINVRMEYKIDSFNTLIITPNLSFQKNQRVSNVTARSAYSNAFDAANLANTSGYLSDALTTAYNFSNNILLRHAFAKRGRTISVGVNTSFNDRDAETFLNSNTKYYSNGTIKDSTVDQFTSNVTNGYTISGNLAYTEPLTAKSQLQFNYIPSFTKNKANQETFQYDVAAKNYSILTTKLSNKFDNTYTSQNAGITYRTGDRDNQFSVGVSAQSSNLESDRTFPTKSSVDKSFFNILPNLQLRRKLSAKSSFNVFFRTSVNAPSVTQLQDVVNTDNQLQYSTGNPDLKQQYTGFLVTRFTFTNTLKGQSFFANLFIQKINNYITNSSFFSTKKDSLLSSGILLPRGVTLTKPLNVDGYFSVRSFLTYGAPLKFIKSTMNVNAAVTYSKLPGLNNYAKTLIDNYSYSTGAVVASNISQYVDFNLSYNANFNVVKQQPSQNINNDYFTSTAGIQFNMLSKKGWFLQNDLNNQVFNYKSNTPDQNFWLWNVSAGKKFLKDQKGELKLSVFDLLKQNKSISRTLESNYIEDVQSQVLQQYFLLTFTYKLKNFGTAATRAQNNRTREQTHGF